MSAGRCSYRVEPVVAQGVSSSRRRVGLRPTSNAPVGSVGGARRRLARARSDGHRRTSPRDEGSNASGRPRDGAEAYRFPQLKAEGVTSGADGWVWTDSVI
jgi:hypothetical protein